MVKNKYKTSPSEATKETKKVETSPEESEPMYLFQGQSARSQYWFELGPDWIKYTFLKREHDFQKDIP